MIDLEFLSPQSDIAAICTRYWQLDRTGQFAENEHDLLPFQDIGELAALETLVGASVIARDTRRRCPLCGMPEQLKNRAAALAPLTPLLPCAQCRYLQRQKNLAGTFADAVITGSNARHLFKYPIGAMVVYDALGLDEGQHRTGFSLYDCEQLNASQLDRFLIRLETAGIISKTEFVSDVHVDETDHNYRRTEDPVFEQDYREFKRMLNDGIKLPGDEVWEVWLDHAVAKCLGFIGNRSVRFGLDFGPASGQLAVALRAALRTHTIGQVRAMSERAVQNAIRQIERGATSSQAAGSIADYLIREEQLVRQGCLKMDPVCQSLYAVRTQMEQWFRKHYELNDHVTGSDAANRIF